MGARAFLDVLPLDIEPQLAQPKERFERVWLLPVLKEHLRGGELAYFAEHLLPLAAQTLALSEQLAANGLELLAKTYHTLYLQIWALLPAFMRSPTDVSTGFRQVARVLGTALETRPELQGVVCSSLQMLIRAVQDDEAGCAAVAQYAKNFLPLFFNLYSSVEPLEGEGAKKGGGETGLRSQLLQTIHSYVSVADPRLLETFFRNVLEKLLQSSTAAAEQKGDAEQLATSTHRLMDLALALAPSMAGESLGLFFRILKPQLQMSDATLQKKSFKGLAILTAGETEAQRAFVRANAEVIKETLIDTQLASKPAAKRTRLQCIQQLIAQLEVCRV